MFKKKLIALGLALVMITTVMPQETVSAKSVPSAIQKATVNASVNLGNTIGNLHNGGYVVEEGDWIYYCDESDGSIWKTKKDGTETKCIFKEENGGILSGLNIEGEWLYYVRYSEEYSTNNKVYTHKNYYHLYRVKLDGTGNEKICSDDVGSYPIPNVKDGWIYFSDGNNLCKIKVDGSNKKILLKDEIDDFCVAGKKIYYLKDNCVYRIKTNGTGKKKVKKAKNAKKFVGIQVYGNWIYYEDTNGNLYRMKQNGNKNKKILKNVQAVNVTDGILYYSVKNKGTYTANLAGKNRKKLCKYSFYCIYVLENDIYGKALIKLSTYKFKLKKDGSKLEQGWQYWENKDMDV